MQLIPGVGGESMPPVRYTTDSSLDGSPRLRATILMLQPSGYLVPLRVWIVRIDRSMTFRAHRLTFRNLRSLWLTKLGGFPSLRGHESTRRIVIFCTVTIDERMRQFVSRAAGLS